jgi:hypothetical protein
LDHHPDSASDEAYFSAKSAYSGIRVSALSLQKKAATRGRSFIEFNDSCH